MRLRYFFLVAVMLMSARFSYSSTDLLEKTITLETELQLLLPKARTLELSSRQLKLDLERATSDYGELEKLYAAALNELEQSKDKRGSLSLELNAVSASLLRSGDLLRQLEEEFQEYRKRQWLRTARDAGIGALIGLVIGLSSGR